MSFPKQVRIVEVGPRDGLQNEATPIDTAIKIQLIEALIDAGLSYIEAGSFVNPKWVPQMADSEAVFQNSKKQPGVTYAALTPNMKGFERAIAAGANEIAIFTAASEAFSQKNTNCNINESISRFKPIMQAAKAASIPVRGYVSCVLGCPYQGEVSEQSVANVSQALYELGCYEISLGDTIGVGSAGGVNKLLDTLLNVLPAEKLAVHFHDTYGQALTNIYAALNRGIAVIDSSVAGLGGCPYAKGATGNVATEDVIYLLNGLGITHGVNLEKVIKAGDVICQQLQRPNNSRVATAWLSKQLNE